METIVILLALALLAAICVIGAMRTHIQILGQLLDQAHAAHTVEAQRRRDLDGRFIRLLKEKRST